MLPEINLLSGAGYGVLAFDWPGDGQSGGMVTWGKGEQIALSAAVDWLSAQPDIDPKALGVIGFSCGGIIVAQVAATDARLRAVVLEATPTTFADYVRWNRRKSGWLSEWPATQALRHLGYQFDLPGPAKVIRSIAPRPVFVIGGEQDEIVPPDMITTLFQAGLEPKWLWLVPGAHHGGYVMAQPVEYPRRIIEFFSDSLIARRN
jgi:pimeloyl-ACP methyl ester carboxylesterase